MSKFTSKAAARKDAQEQGKSLGEIEIEYNEKAKQWSWKLAEVKPVAPSKAPANSTTEATKKANGKANGRGRATRFQSDQIITVLVDKNPKRVGTTGYKIFEYYENGQTVEENLKAGGRKQDLRWDVNHKFISIE